MFNKIRFIKFQPSKEQTHVGGESISPKAQRRQKDGSGTNSAVNAFRQWRRSASAGNKSNGGGSNSSALGRMSNDHTTVQKLEQFPLALSDANMPDEDLSLKFLALVNHFLFFSFKIIKVN